MAAFVIEIQRGDAWSRLTTIRIMPTGPADEVAARYRAYRQANQHLSGWQSHFGGYRLRIREAA